MRKNLNPEQVTITDFQILVRERESEEDIIIPLQMVGNCSVQKQGTISYSVVIEYNNGDAIILTGLSKKKAENYQCAIIQSIKRATKTFSPVRTLHKAGEMLINLAADEECDPRTIINFLLIQAHHLRASDIHFKPSKENLQVLMRIDGLLTNLAAIPLPLYEKIILCIKNISKLLAYKKSIPQDGRIRFQYAGIDLDVRVALLPTLFGEKTVFRILNPGMEIINLDSLGLEPETLSSYRNLIFRPQGTIILTGPAGSGKTTTIFSSLLELSRHFEDKVNISTIEDPIEYIVENFTQTQVNPALGLTFSSGLRTLLRQDPNIILVGEIRDEETASIAMQAALSGHLIFSTLHSTDSLGVFSRLIDMGVEPYLVSSCICGVLYQRLIRKLCPACKEEKDATPEVIKEFNQHSMPLNRVMRSGGCQECGNTGYKGRTGIFELLHITPRLQDLIHRRSPHFELLKAAKEERLKTLWEDALIKLRDGITTFEEITRVCPRDNK